MDEQSQADDNGGVAVAGDSLTVTDNRTGQTYEVPIVDGTVKAMDFRQMKASDDDFGLMTYDPAFTNTASCRSSITYIDGDKGILEHRGIPIEQLCEKLELPRGRLPAGPRRAADQGRARLLGLRDHPPHLRPRGHQEVARGLPLRRPPDGDAALDRRRAVDLLSRVEEHRRPDRALHGDRPADREDADAGGVLLPPQPRPALRLPGQRPLVHRQLPRRCSTASTEPKYEPDPRLERALDVLWILHADHEQNCSTAAVRSVGSSQVDPYSAVAAGDRRALRPAARRRQRGRAADARPDRDGREHPGLPRGRQGRQGEADGLRPPGLQELRPARQDHQEARRRGARRASASTTRSSRSPIELEKHALDDDYFTSRKLYPNVDFYSGLIYEAMNIPTDMFTVMFAIPRTSGWLAQWKEMLEDDASEDRPSAADLHGAARHRLRRRSASVSADA